MIIADNNSGLEDSLNDAKSLEMLLLTEAGLKKTTVKVTD